MPNNVTNRLEIHCEDSLTMDKIKMMIFDEDSEKNIKFTMQKMLPLPIQFSENRSWSLYGHDWSLAMWGTKWDVYDVSVSASGNSIVLHYHTAWGPNDNYVELLCLYINTALGFKNKSELPEISVRLKYFDIPGGFGGKMEWVPFTHPKSEKYDILQYAKLHDSGMYESLKSMYNIKE